MSDIIQEIERAIDTLGLAKQVWQLPPDKEQSLYDELAQEFLDGKKRQWWWEGFVKPSASLSFQDNTGFRHILGLVPSVKEDCWLMAEGDTPNVFSIYEATPEYALKIIGECFAFEYYLIAKDMRWLICENHHGVIVGVGPEIIGNIQRVTA